MIEESKIQKFNDSLVNKKLSIVCAESVTAGLLASSIASISGASSIFKGSVVTYSSELKLSILKVDPRIIDTHSAESIETTVEMVYGLIKLYPSSDIYVAITGVASPSDNYKLKAEVGDIFIAIYYKNLPTEKRLITIKEKLGDVGRNKVREQAVEYIFESILKII